MSWLAVITSLIKLISVFADYLNNKQLLDAGEAKAISEGQNEILLKLQQVKAARLALDDPESDRPGRLRKRFERPE